ncbi:MAG: flagellar biosynthesis protein FlhB, partial [Rhodobacteraceae bacterium]
FTSEIGEEISDKLYNAVAVALAYIYRIDNGEYIEEPNIDIPPDLQLNEHGKPI